MSGMTPLTSGSGRESIRQRRIAATLLTVAQLGYAHTLFGNVYEAVVKIPNRLAGCYDPGGEDRRLPSLFSPGSPVRYYLPGVPLTVTSTLAALVLGSTRRGDRRWLTTATCCTILSGALTGYLVRAVNVKLFVAGHPVTPAEREVLLRRWHRLNVIRITALGAAWLAAEHVRSRPDTR